MSSSFRCLLLALTTAAAGALALSLSAVAGADVSASPAAPADIVIGPVYGDPGFTIAPDPADGDWAITSTTGLAPYYTTVEEEGTFVANQVVVVGHASYFSDMFGDHKVLLDRFYNGDVTQVIDQFNFGSSGFENIYDEVVGGGANGANSITDTLVTPFGDVNIPTMYDAAAVFDAGNFAPAAATDWLGALSAN